jgi:hypothetical protein
MDGKGAKIQLPNIARILHVEFASSFASSSVVLYY